MKKAAFFLGLTLVVVSWAGAAFLGGQQPQMGVSGANVYIAWLAAPDGISPQQVHLIRSQDGGSHWLPEQTLTNESGWSNGPSLAVSGPNVYIVYQTFVSSWIEVHLIVSRNRGRTWSVPISLSTAGILAADPKIIVTGSTVMAFWVQYAQIYCTRSTNSGGAWSVPQMLYAQSGEQTNVVATVDGKKMAVAYERVSGSAWYLEYLYSLNGGASWQGSTDVFSLNGSFAPVMDIQMTWPRVGILWQSLSDYQVWLSRSNDGGSTWFPGMQVTDALGSIRSMSAAHSGYSSYLAYADPPSINSTVYFMRSTNMGWTWKPAKMFSPAGHDCTSPSVMASGSKVWLCYWDSVFNSDGIGLTLYLRKSSDKGVTWQAAKAIATAQIYL
jgi:hypothetical protein